MNNNRKKITKYSGKYLPFSPYSPEDFIQQAYISAFEAIKESTKKKDVKFESCFWVRFKSDCCDMATNPSKMDVVPESEDKSPCVFEEYREEYSEENHKPATPQIVWNLTQFDFLDETEALANKASIREAMNVMTLRERLIWDYILGLCTPAYTIQELASIETVSRQCIAKLRDNGLERVRRFYGNA